jgi:hypothetical protein
LGGEIFVLEKCLILFDQAYTLLQLASGSCFCCPF